MKLVSCIMTSNKPENWMMCYDSLCSGLKDVDAEIIVVGPNPPDYKLPSNLIYIQTNDIKPSQCVEIAIRKAQGDFIAVTADDVVFIDGSLNSLYLEYIEREDEKLVLLSRFWEEAIQKRVLDRRYAKGCMIWPKNSPLCSLLMAFLDRDLLTQIGGIDKRYLAVYWDIDLSLRLVEAGSTIRWSNESTLVTEKLLGMPKGSSEFRITKKVRKWERWITDQIWTRPIVPGEPVPSDIVYDNYKGVDGKAISVFSKVRLDKVEEFEDKDITLYSQGTKKYKSVEWL